MITVVIDIGTIIDIVIGTRIRRLDWCKHLQNWLTLKGEIRWWGGELCGASVAAWRVCCSLVFPEFSCVFCWSSRNILYPSVAYRSGIILWYVLFLRFCFPSAKIRLERLSQTVIAMADVWSSLSKFMCKYDRSSPPGLCSLHVSQSNGGRVAIRSLWHVVACTSWPLRRLSFWVS